MTFQQIEETPKLAPEVPKVQELNLKDLKVIKPIGQSKVTVYLVQSKTTKSFYALKVYPFHNKEMHPGYVTESQFSVLQHKNIISIIGSSDKQSIATRPGHSAKVSLVLMELAPYSDFYELLFTQKFQFNEKLARTYFRQLIEATQYMHSNGVAHRDLKLENLLLGENYQLKVADFDCSSPLKAVECSPGYTYGTFCYRAPEVLNKTSKDFAAVDVYSCGILLFLFQTGGALPHCEEKLYKNTNLLDLLNNNKPAFWQKHSEFQSKDQSFFGQEFKDLFEGMTECDVSKRFTIEDVKASKWYQGDVYSNEELVSIMREKLE